MEAKRKEKNCRGGARRYEQIKVGYCSEFFSFFFLQLHKILPHKNHLEALVPLR